MRPPDLNAPRCRYNYHTATGKEFINKFRDKYPQYSQYSNKQLITFIKNHNNAIWKKVINYRDGVELQGELGKIFIGMYPPLKHPVRDTKKSIALGMDVYHKNHETDGKVGKIMYTNYGTKYQLKHRNLWEFTAVRQFCRTFSDNLPANWRMYHFMDSYKSIWALLDSRNYADKMIRSTNKELKTYNEFDLE